jgi:hypothetical protein
MNVSKSNDTVMFNKDELEVLMVCSLRYCQGRKTYMPNWVRDIIRPHLKELSTNTIAIMKNDCESQTQFGDDKFDKPGWEHWEKEVTEEYNSRFE